MNKSIDYVIYWNIVNKSIEIKFFVKKKIFFSYK